MTTYNGASFLREQLDSIFAQARLPDELIVCDDRSTDETPHVLREHAERAPFPMTVVINKQRLGSTKNFEQAIRLCSGELIALCDQDDVWYPHKLTVIEGRFKDDPEIGLVFSNGDLIDGRGARLPGDIWSRFFFGRRLRRLLNSSRNACDLLLSRYFVTGATMAFRSRFRDVVLPLPDTLPTFIHDRWIAVVAGALGRIDGIEQRLIAYRLHPQQQMGVGKDQALRKRFAPSRCSSDCEALRIMRQRLVGEAPDTTKSEFISALDARERHVAARSALSGNVMTRLRGVAREYLLGHYQRYPLGRLDALKDLLAGTR